MSAAALGSLPLRPSHPEDGGRGLLLALGAHALLIWALAVGVNWRSSPDDRVAEAELWALVPQAAAPRAAEPPPPPAAAVERPAPAPKADDRAAEMEAELAAQREKRRKDEMRRQAEEEAERQEARRKQLAAERREAEKREAEKREAERRKLSEQKKTEREAKAEEARREQQRQENLRRLQGLAGASSTNGSPEAVGSAARSAGPSAGYAGRIMARIKPNITFTETLTQRQVAEVLVRCAPDGLIISRRIVKSSGNPAWDEAVLKAIDKTERLPRDTDGRVPAEIAMVFNSSE